MIFNDAKAIQIKKIFSTLKILAVLFSSIPYFLFFSDKLENLGNDHYANVLIMLISTAIVCFVVFFWTFLSNLALKKLAFQIAEIIIFYSLFIFSIYLSGAHESYYKFIFLFIIISYTIEYGINTGVILATLSSLTVLAIDLIFGGGTGLNMYFQNDLTLSAMFLLVAWTLGYYVKLEINHIDVLTEYANIDGLTGLFNHRYFHEYLNTVFSACVAEERELSLIMFDIDHFKNYNDMYGHQTGDELLKELTAIIKKTLRSTDVFCRYGGDEFCIMLPDASKEVAYKVAQRIKDAVSEHTFKGIEFMPDGKISISVGVVSLDDQIDTYTTLIENADSALYKAKFLRRNRVEVYSSVFDIAELDSDIFKSMKTLITVVNSRDTYTYKHVERVVDFCRLMADYLQLSEDERKRLIYSAYLHDLGKINIPKEVLIKETKLSDSEWELIKAHPTDSAYIVGQINGFDDIIPIIRHHHEKFDGSGYPDHLAGDDIEYLSRILTIVDSFDAMTSQRPYQKVKTFDEAFEEIVRCKGSHFDPYLADKFIEMLKSQ